MKQFMVFDTPYQNGFFKQNNQMLVGMTITMFIHLKISNTLWGRVLKTTNYLQNMSPTKYIVNGKTLIEV
jgi:hypothetical protein